MAELAGRQRKDAASGLVLLDEAGRDLLQVGLVGGPSAGGVVQQRIAQATGIMVCDGLGNEQGGFGCMSNERVVLGMDDANGEGVMVYVAPDLKSRGVLINGAPRPGDNGGPAPRLFLGLGQADEAALELRDAGGANRLVARAPAKDEPQLLTLDPEGQEIADLAADE